MKNYRPVFVPDERTSELNAAAIFSISDLESQLSCDMFWQLIDSEGHISDKFEELVRLKQETSKGFRHVSVNALLSEIFYVDGAIKLNENDIKDLQKAMVAFSPDGKRLVGTSVDEHFNVYVNRLVNDLAYVSGKNLIFRGPKYYFILDGLKLDKKGRTSSINNFIVADIDAEKYFSAISEQFNSINQHINTFSTYFNGNLHQDLMLNRKKFCADLLKIVGKSQLDAVRQKIDSGKFDTGNTNIDKFYMEQYIESLAELEKLHDIVAIFDSRGSAHMLGHINEFLASHSALIRYVKIVFGIDIDAVFNRHVKTLPPRAMRKIILGFLDAKINMLAFAQNIAQIMYSDHFMNSEFQGSLVFSQEIVRSIRKKCPKKFEEFKVFQQRMKDREANISLLTDLEDYTAFYLDILLEKNSLAYTKIVGQLPDRVQEITEGKTDSIPRELEDVILLIKKFFDLLDSYIEECEQADLIRAVKSEKKGRSYKSPGCHCRVKSIALKKLIRLYREENDPLVMIKSAQNALNIIIKKGFDPTKDVLHVMSVNYGGTLVGLYAKHVFASTVNRGQVLSNPGALVYSIYDVKNANHFSALTDYPFSRIMKDETVSASVREKLEKENWLLVFDDNTNSGETLDNIRLLAEQTGFYGRIDLFPCRASANLANYKKSLTDQQKLTMVANCALISRKAKVNPEGARYKELLGTIVGNRLSKIIDSDQKRSSEH